MAFFKIRNIFLIVQHIGEAVSVHLAYAGDGHEGAFIYSHDRTFYLVEIAVAGCAEYHTCPL